MSSDSTTWSSELDPQSFQERLVECLASGRSSKEIELMLNQLCREAVSCLISDTKHQRNEARPLHLRRGGKPVTKAVEYGPKDKSCCFWSNGCVLTHTILSKDRGPGCMKYGLETEYLINVVRRNGSNRAAMLLGSDQRRHYLSWSQPNEKEGLNGPNIFIRLDGETSVLEFPIVAPETRCYPGPADPVSAFTNPHRPAVSSESIVSVIAQATGSYSLKAALSSFALFDLSGGVKTIRNGSGGLKKPKEIVEEPIDMWCAPCRKPIRTGREMIAHVESVPHKVNAGFAHTIALCPCGEDVPMCMWTAHVATHIFKKDLVVVTVNHSTRWGVELPPTQNVELEKLCDEARGVKPEAPVSLPTSSEFAILSPRPGCHKLYHCKRGTAFFVEERCSDWEDQGFFLGSIPSKRLTGLHRDHSEVAGVLAGPTPYKELPGGLTACYHCGEVFESQYLYGHYEHHCRSTSKSDRCPICGEKGATLFMALHKLSCQGQ